MEFQTAKIISAPTLECWSQVYIEDDLFLIIKLEKETNLPSLGREIISRFHQEYSSLSQEGILEKLEEALGKIEKEFAKINLEMVIGCVFKDALYLGILNQGRTVLLREGNLVTILEGKEGKEGVVTVSGFLQEGDLFVLGTERFFEFVNREILKTSLTNKDPEEVIEALAPLIHGSEEDGGAAAVVVKRQKSKGKRKKSLLLKEVSEKAKNWLAEFVTRPRTVYLPRREKKEEKKQRMMMTIAITLTFLLLLSIVFGWQKKKKEKELRRFNQFWEEIEYKYEQGKELVEINSLRARELLEETRQLAKERKDDFSPKSWQYQKLATKEEEIERELEKVLREYELTEVPVFLDLGLVKGNLRGIDFDFWQDKMVVLGEDGTVVTIDLKKKSQIKGLVVGGELATLWGEKTFVLGEKIVEVGNKTEIEKEWDEAVGFEAFAGNLYLLDKGKSEIFKVPAIESGFGAKRSWFGPEVEPDLSHAVAFAIDGDLWVLKETGEILKFSRGAPQAFGVAGLDQELSSPTDIYTDEASQKIYILDKSNKRIVVLLKSGEYDSQYLWEGIEAVSDIVVSESEKKILLLGGKKIFEIEIR